MRKPASFCLKIYLVFHLSGLPQIAQALPPKQEQTQPASQNMNHWIESKVSSDQDRMRFVQFIESLPEKDKSVCYNPSNLQISDAAACENLYRRFLAETAQTQHLPSIKQPGQIPPSSLNLTPHKTPTITDPAKAGEHLHGTFEGGNGAGEGGVSPVRPGTGGTQSQPQDQAQQEEKGDKKKPDEYSQGQYRHEGTDLNGAWLTYDKGKPHETKVFITEKGDFQYMEGLDPETKKRITQTMEMHDNRRITKQTRNNQVVIEWVDFDEKTKKAVEQEVLVYQRDAQAPTGMGPLISRQKSNINDKNQADVVFQEGKDKESGEWVKTYVLKTSPDQQAIREERGGKTVFITIFIDPKTQIPRGQEIKTYAGIVHSPEGLRPLQVQKSLQIPVAGLQYDAKGNLILDPEWAWINNSGAVPDSWKNEIKRQGDGIQELLLTRIEDYSGATWMGQAEFGRKIQDPRTGEKKFAQVHILQALGALGSAYTEIRVLSLGMQTPQQKKILGQGQEAIHKGAGVWLLTENGKTLYATIERSYVEEAKDLAEREKRIQEQAYALIGLSYYAGNSTWHDSKPNPNNAAETEQFRQHEHMAGALAQFLQDDYRMKEPDSMEAMKKFQNLKPGESVPFEKMERIYDPGVKGVQKADPQIIVNQTRGRLVKGQDGKPQEIIESLFQKLGKFEGLAKPACNGAGCVDLGLSVLNRSAKNHNDQQAQWTKFMQYIGNFGQDQFRTDVKTKHGIFLLTNSKTWEEHYVLRKTKNEFGNWSDQRLDVEVRTTFEGGGILTETGRAISIVGQGAVDLVGSGVAGGLGVTFGWLNSDFQNEMFERMKTNFYNNAVSREFGRLAATGDLADSLIILGGPAGWLGSAAFGDQIRDGVKAFGQAYQEGHKSLNLNEEKYIQNVGQEMTGLGYENLGFVLQRGVNFANTVAPMLMFMGGSGFVAGFGNTGQKIAGVVNAFFIFDILKNGVVSTVEAVDAYGKLKERERLENTYGLDKDESFRMAWRESLGHAVDSAIFLPFGVAGALGYAKGGYRAITGKPAPKGAAPHTGKFTEFFTKPRGSKASVIEYKLNQVKMQEFQAKTGKAIDGFFSRLFRRGGNPKGGTAPAMTPKQTERAAKNEISESKYQDRLLELEKQRLELELELAKETGGEKPSLDSIAKRAELERQLSSVTEKLSNHKMNLARILIETMAAQPKLAEKMDAKNEISQAGKWMKEKDARLDQEIQRLNETKRDAAQEKSKIEQEIKNKQKELADNTQKIEEAEQVKKTLETEGTRREIGRKLKELRQAEEGLRQELDGMEIDRLRMDKALEKIGEQKHAKTARKHEIEQEQMRDVESLNEAIKENLKLEQETPAQTKPAETATKTPEKTPKPETVNEAPPGTEVAVPHPDPVKIPVQAAKSGIEALRDLDAKMETEARNLGYRNARDANEVMKQKIQAGEKLTPSEQAYADLATQRFQQLTELPPKEAARLNTEEFRRWGRVRLKETYTPKDIQALKELAEALMERGEMEAVRELIKRAGFFEENLPLDPVQAMRNKASNLELQTLLEELALRLEPPRETNMAARKGPSRTEKDLGELLRTVNKKFKTQKLPDEAAFLKMLELLASEHPPAQAPGKIASWVKKFSPHLRKGAFETAKNKGKTDIRYLGKDGKILKFEPRLKKFKTVEPEATASKSEAQKNTETTGKKPGQKSSGAQLLEGYLERMAEASFRTDKIGDYKIDANGRWHGPKGRFASYADVIQAIKRVLENKFRPRPDLKPAPAAVKPSPKPVHQKSPMDVIKRNIAEMERALLDMGIEAPGLEGLSKSSSGRWRKNGKPVKYQEVQKILEKYLEFENDLAGSRFSLLEGKGNAQDKLLGVLDLLAKSRSGVEIKVEQLKEFIREINRAEGKEILKLSEKDGVLEVRYRNVHAKGKPEVQIKFVKKNGVLEAVFIEPSGAFSVYDPVKMEFIPAEELTVKFEEIKTPESRAPPPSTKIFEPKKSPASKKSSKTSTAPEPKPDPAVLKALEARLRQMGLKVKEIQALKKGSSGPLETLQRLQKALMEKMETRLSRLGRTPEEIAKISKNLAAKKNLNASEYIKALEKKLIETLEKKLRDNGVKKKDIDALKKKFKTPEKTIEALEQALIERYIQLLKTLGLKETQLRQMLKNRPIEEIVVLFERLIAKFQIGSRPPVNPSFSVKPKTKPRAAKTPQKSPKPVEIKPAVKPAAKTKTRPSKTAPKTSSKPDKTVTPAKTVEPAKPVETPAGPVKPETAKLDSAKPAETARAPETAVEPPKPIEATVEPAKPAEPVEMPAEIPADVVRVMDKMQAELTEIGPFKKNGAGEWVASVSGRPANPELLRKAVENKYYLEKDFIEEFALNRTLMRHKQGVPGFRRAADPVSYDMEVVVDEIARMVRNEKGLARKAWDVVRRKNGRSLEDTELEAMKASLAAMGLNPSYAQLHRAYIEIYKRLTSMRRHQKPENYQKKEERFWWRLVFTNKMPVRKFFLVKAPIAIGRLTAAYFTLGVSELALWAGKWMYRRYWRFKPKSGSHGEKIIEEMMRREFGKVESDPVKIREAAELELAEIERALQEFAKEKEGKVELEKAAKNLNHRIRAARMEIKPSEYMTRLMERKLALERILKPFRGMPQPRVPARTLRIFKTPMETPLLRPGLRSDAPGDAPDLLAPEFADMKGYQPSEVPGTQLASLSTDGLAGPDNLPSSQDPNSASRGSGGGSREGGEGGGSVGDAGGAGGGEGNGGGGGGGGGGSGGGGPQVAEAGEEGASEEEPALAAQEEDLPGGAEETEEAPSSDAAPETELAQAPESEDGASDSPGDGENGMAGSDDESEGPASQGGGLAPWQRGDGSGWEPAHSRLGRAIPMLRPHGGESRRTAASVEKPRYDWPYVLKPKVVPVPKLDKHGSENQEEMAVYLPDAEQGPLFGGFLWNGAPSSIDDILLFLFLVLFLSIMIARLMKRYV